MPFDNIEKKLLYYLNCLKVISKSMYNSTIYKIRIYNKIWALLKTYSCSTLFLTLNLYNIYYKLIHILSNGPFIDFNNLFAFNRTKQIADNPTAVAIFFDIIIKVSVNIIL